MELVTVKELYGKREEYIGKTISVGGWVRSIRDSKTFGFLVLHDGTFFDTLQVVFGDKLENFAEICKYNVGSAVIVTSAPEDEPVPGDFPRAFPGGVRDPQVLPGEELCVYSYPDHHCFGCRGRRRDVPLHDSGS